MSDGSVEPPPPCPFHKRQKEEHTTCPNASLRFRRRIVAILLIAFSVYGFPAFAIPTFSDPTPYRSVADSPLAGHTFTYFYLETSKMARSIQRASGFGNLQR